MDVVYRNGHMIQNHFAGIKRSGTLKLERILPAKSSAMFLVTQKGQKKKIWPLRAGFEPARGDPIGFQVQRLNHSAIAASLLKNDFENRNEGIPRCQRT